MSRSWVANTSPAWVRVEQVSGDHVEAKTELVEQLVLPLPHEAARSDDQAALDVPADHQLLDVEAGHDRLARARVVCKEEAQRLARQHLAVDRLDLMRKWLDHARRERKVGIKQVSETDSPRLGREAEQVPVAVEAPRSAGAVGDAERAFVGAVEEPLLDPGSMVPEDQRQGLRAVPLGGDDRDRTGRVDGGRDCASYQVFESGHRLCLPCRVRQVPRLSPAGTSGAD